MSSHGHGHSKVYDTPVTEEHSRSPRRGYETRDWHLRPILILGVVLIVLAVIGNLVLFTAFSWWTNRQARVDPAPPPLALPDQTPPEPRLQLSPRRDWQTMMAEDNQLLNSYGWVDQQAGTVRIPIERAMDLVLERGLPARSGEGESQASPDLQGSDDLDSEGGQPPESDATTQPEAP